MEAIPQVNPVDGSLRIRNPLASAPIVPITSMDFPSILV